MAQRIIPISNLDTPETLSEKRRQMAKAQFAQAQQQLGGRQLVANQAGQQIGEAIRRLTLKYNVASDPEMDKAQQVQSALDAAEAAYEPDPTASSFANESNRLKIQTDHLRGLLTPEQRTEAVAKTLAYDVQDYNMQRLKASDERAVKAANDKVEQSKLDLDIKTLQLKTMRDVQERGLQADPGVFEITDKDGNKRRVEVGVNGKEFNALLDKVNDDEEGGVKFVGFHGELATRALAEARQKAIDAKADRKPLLHTTDGQKKSYSALSQAAQIINNLESPEGVEGVSRFGGWNGLWDNFVDTYGAYIPGVPDVSKSAYAATQAANLSVVQQQFIQGVPSNFDQQLIELTKLNRVKTPPEIAAQRTAFLKEDVVRRTRVAYADFVENAREGQPIPRGIIQAMNGFGITASSIGSAEDEYAALNNMKERADKLLQQYRQYSEGATGSGDNSIDSEQF